jgi:hypothetical protein
MSVLLNTKLRKKLLTYSFTHLGENYYVRELCGLIDGDPGNLSRELRTLEEDMVKGSWMTFPKLSGNMVFPGVIVVNFTGTGNST